MPQLIERIKTTAPTLASEIKSCAKHIAAGASIALAIATVGSVTGCNDYVLAQVDQDVATSTSQPLLATSVNQDDLDDDARYLASKQYADAKHANDFLASVRGVQ